MTKQCVYLTAAALFLALAVAPAGAQHVVSGFNPNLPPIHFDVPFDPTGGLEFGHWQVDQELLFDPSAPRMEKWFHSPRNASGPIQLDAQQPLPIPIWENWKLNSSSFPVSDWHEELLEPGWVWRFDPDGSGGPNTINPLITRDGKPWPWMPIPMPGGSDPTKIWVKFPPINPPHVLDIHKELLWVGTPQNRIWGDGVLDDGTTFDETMILVREYPTPEPSTVLLMALGLMALIGIRRRL